MTAPGAMALTRMSSAECAGERIGEADHAGLGGGVGDEIGAPEHPGGRGEIDDRAVAELLHVRVHRLRGEELVPQIDVHRAVPVLRRHLVDRLAVIVGGVVDQHGDRPERGPHARDRRPQRLDVGEVAADEERRMRGAPKGSPTSASRRFAVDVDEGDLRALAGEGLDDRRADAGSAAGDEDDAVLRLG